MNAMLLDFVLTAIPLAMIAWLCVYISRPFPNIAWIKIATQALASFLLLVAFLISKGVSEDKSSASLDDDTLIMIVSAYFGMKFISMYLISCYAKTVNKSPYWSFVGLLNFSLAIILMIFKLWRSGKKVKLNRDEVIGGLKAMVDDPSTAQDKRDWATNRLRSLEKLKP